MPQVPHHHHHRHHHHHHHHHGNLFLDIPMNVVRWLGFLLWFLIVIFLPLFYRGGEYWWLPAALSVTLLASACWLLSRAYYGRRIGKNGLTMPMPHWDIAYCILLLPIFIGMLQCIPMPKGLLGILSGHAKEIWSSVGAGFATITIWPEATRRRMTLLLVAGLIFFSTRNFCKQKKYIYCTLIGISCGVLLIALVGLLQAASPKLAALSPFIPIGIRGEIARGVFVNRNHFGFLMTIGICTTTGLLFMLNSMSVGAANNAIGIRQRKKRKIYRALLAINLFIIYAANTASLSRGSFISANLALIGFGLVWLKYKHKETLEQRRNAIAAIIIFVVAMLFALPPVLQQISNRFQVLTQEDSISNIGRVKIWKATASLIGDYWLTGVGLGAYEDAIQPYTYQEDELLTVNAHNDFIETVAEIGIPMALLLGFLCFKILKRSWRGLAHSDDLTKKIAGLTAFVTLVACAFHEFIDYSLQAYPNAVCFAAIMGIMVAVSEEQGNEADAASTVTSTVTHSNRTIPLLLGIASLVLLVPSVFMLRASFSNHLAWMIQHPDYKPALGLGVVSTAKKLDLSEKAYNANKSCASSASSYANALYAYSRECKDLVERREYVKKAYDMQKEAVKLRPSDFYGWCQQANMSYAMLRFDEAIEDVERAIKLAPTLTEPRLTASLFYSSIALWHDKATAKKYKERATQLRREILRDRQELALKMLPSLLTADTTAEEILEWCQPKEKLAFAILDLLLKRQRFSDLKVIIDNFPEESENINARNLKLVNWKVIAEQFTTNTEDGGDAVPATNALPIFNEWFATIRQLKNASYERSHLKTNDTMIAVDDVTKKLANEPLGPLPARRLEAAKVLIGVANIAGAVNALVPLVYPEPIWEPTEDELEQAYSLLSPLKANRDTADGFRMDALRQMLKIKIGLANNDIPQENLDTLTALAKQYWERRSSDGQDFIFGRISWLQAHLMDYYIGLCAEARGDMKTAVSSYERILKNFPTNSSAVKRLAKISPDNLKATNLLVVPFTDKKPLSFFGSSVGIVSVDVKPKEIKALHDKMEIDVTLRMFDSTTDTIDLKAHLSTKQGVFATIPLSTVDRYQHNSLLWEQGAIIRLHGVLPNVLTRAVIHGKKINSQYIMIEIIQGLKTQANPRLFIPVPLREATQND